MGGKRRAQPAGVKRGKAAAGVEGAAQAGGAWEFGVECARVIPSDDTLQRVLPLVLERLQPQGAVQLFQVCPIAPAASHSSPGSRVVLVGLA